MSRVSVVIPCYRDGDRALLAARLITQQSTPPGWDLEVVVVDDGSDDGSADRLRSGASERIRVVALRTNVGRSGARNRGAESTNGNVVVFLDSDCVPQDTRFLAAHIRSLQGGAVASSGPVFGSGGGFWDDYQQRASARRAEQHAKGLACAGSSQNLAVVRDAFLHVGGFDPAFLGYGFEDRDLLARLGTVGPVAWSDAARVCHTDDVSLRSVAEKIRSAGASTASMFRSRHPDAYRALGYAALDASLHSWLVPIARLSSPLVPFAAHAVDHLIRRGWAPAAILRVGVKAVSGLAFLSGTVKPSR